MILHYTLINNTKQILILCYQSPETRFSSVDILISKTEETNTIQSRKSQSDNDCKRLVRLG